MSDDAQFWIDLGGVLEAYKQRAFMREAVKASKDALKAARRDRSIFGLYEDCGDSYQSAYDEANSGYNTTVRYKVSAEKNFKKVNLTFLETYPGRAETVLATYLPGDH